MLEDDFVNIDFLSLMIILKQSNGKEDFENLMLPQK